ncbi:hypothetical protein DFH27DRAFT_226331 [Peziza echinospora]|nr:hypothetical protein DFH27DRAFT_226331 [Peziza echinospora]
MTCQVLHPCQLLFLTIATVSFSLSSASGDDCHPLRIRAATHCCARKEYAPRGCHHGGLLDMHCWRVASSRSFFSTQDLQYIHFITNVKLLLPISIHVIFIIFSSLLPLNDPNAWEFAPRYCPPPRQPGPNAPPRGRILA